MTVPPAAATVLLEHAWVVACDGAGTQGRLSVAVEHGHIAAIGPLRELRDGFPRAKRIRCSRRILLPGLVNAHVHPDLHLLKGALEGLGLHDWNRADDFNAAVDHLGTEEGRPLQRASIRASLAEAALGGTTCVATYGVTDNSVPLCEQALREIGLRGHITIRDVHFAPVDALMPTVAAGPPPRSLYRLHAEESLYEAELEAAAAAHARGARLVMHAAETEHRVALARQRFGTTTIRLLDRFGLLSPRTLLSHAVHIDDQEADLIAARGAHVVVSPAAEMKLGDGIPPVTALLERGVIVALGTDAAVCNNATDMFLEMRALGLAQKLRSGPAALSAEQILLMATRNGATALGDAGQYGVIETGAAADLILVDATSPRLQPLITTGPRPNVAANLVFAATAADVTDVMVAGDWVVRGRRLRNASLRQILHELADAAQRLHHVLRNGA